MSERGHQAPGPVVRSRTVTWHDPAATAAAGRELSGLAYLRAIGAGELAGAPIASMLDFAAIEVEEGRVLFAAEPQEFHYNPLGIVHGALTAALIDSAAGCAVHSTLPPGVGYTTVDLSMTFVRPVTVQSGPLLCEGQVVHRGRRLASAEAQVRTDADAKLVAHGRASCLLLYES